MSEHQDVPPEQDQPDEPAGWDTSATDCSGDEIHVMPLDDLVPHETTPLCLCGPTGDIIGPEDTGGRPAMMYTHHSLDGRELAEPDYDPPRFGC